MTGIQGRTGRDNWYILGCTWRRTVNLKRKGRKKRKKREKKKKKRKRKAEEEEEEVEEKFIILMVYHPNGYKVLVKCKTFLLIKIKSLFGSKHP